MDSLDALFNRYEIHRAAQVELRTLFETARKDAYIDGTESGWAAIQDADLLRRKKGEFTPLCPCCVPDPTETLRNYTTE